MTYLEKVKELYPETSDESIIKYQCPKFHFWINEISYCQKAFFNSRVVSCSECWNQEYRGEEPR